MAQNLCFESASGPVLKERVRSAPRHPSSCPPHHPATSSLPCHPTTPPPLLLPTPPPRILFPALPPHHPTTPPPAHPTTPHPLPCPATPPPHHPTTYPPHYPTTPPPTHPTTPILLALPPLLPPSPPPFISPALPSHHPSSSLHCHPTIHPPTNPHHPSSSSSLLCHPTNPPPTHPTNPASLPSRHPATPQPRHSSTYLLATLILRKLSSRPPLHLPTSTPPTPPPRQASPPHLHSSLPTLLPTPPPRQAPQPVGMIRKMMMDPVAAWVVDHATGMDRQGGELAPLSYKDFTPDCLDPGGALHQPKYERFPLLVNRANTWLRQNPQFIVRTCESIELKWRSSTNGIVDTDTSQYLEYGQGVNKFHRALRIWLCPKGPDDSQDPEQVGYMNIVPMVTEQGNLFVNPKFESLSQTMKRFNDGLRTKTLPGRILNIETQDMKCHRNVGTADPDECYWRQRGDHGAYFLVVLRLFYVVGPPAYEELCCVDFIPAKIQPAGFASQAQYQKFEGVVYQARQWLAHQQGIKFVSVQSVDCKLKKKMMGEKLDTHQMAFLEGRGYTHYIRILRIMYTRPLSGLDLNAPPPPVLTYRTFAPVQLTSGGCCGMPDFTPVSKTMRQAQAWLKATGCKVVSTETVPVRLYSGNQCGDHEQTYTQNPVRRNEIYFYVLRIYISGDYCEPSPAALPPEPQPIQKNCCGCCCTIL